MSRTDVHRPWNVQVTDPNNRHLLYRYGEWRGEQLYTSYRNIGCGCRMCTGHFWRKQRHRAQRTQWRSQRAQLLAAVDWQDLDVPPPRHTW